MMGKPSENMIMEERHPTYDYNYEYEYLLDDYGRITQIIRRSFNIVLGSHDLLNATTFSITNAN